MADPVVWIDGPEDLCGALEAEARALVDLIAGRSEAADRGTPLELSIVLMEDAEIRPLNAKWRGVDRATDVLAFPMGEGPMLGDVVISFETAAARVDGQAWRLQDELLFLLIHGALHLLGHDHHEDGERRRMEEAEQALWTAMGRAGTLREPAGS